MKKYTDGLEFLQEAVDNSKEWKKNKDKHGSIRTNMGDLALTSELYGYVGVEEEIIVIDNRGDKYKMKINLEKQ